MGKFCKNCGAQLNENQQVCLNCGAMVEDKADNTSQDNGSVGWGVLGFFIPLVGLILYCIWKNSMPRNARMAGKGALIGFIINIVCGIIWGIIVGLAGAAITSGAYNDYYALVAQSIFV